jgi:hypothetical protein
MSSLALPLRRDASNRGLWVALAVSLAVHLLVFTLAPKPRYDEVGPRDDQPPLRVEIVQRAVETPKVETPPAPRREPTTRPAPPRGDRRAPTPRVTPQLAPVPTPPAPPTTEPPAVTPPTPTFDMAAMIAARRDRRLAAEAAMARGVPESPVPSQQDAAQASLNRNLQTLHGREGVGGIFQILHMGTRTGEFAFNGWRPDSQRQWREVIEVDAGQGGDLQLAMVRRMIELIRTHYTGEFNWESRRLQRVVVLSARTEDSAELEDFLMREFFDTPLATRRPGFSR